MIMIFNKTEHSIHLRIFSEVSTRDAAMAVVERLSEILGDFGSLTICHLGPYWKIPEYFEFSIVLRGPYISEDKIHEISRKLAGNWIDSGGGLVWNIKVDELFIEPSIRWACLEYFEE